VLCELFFKKVDGNELENFLTDPSNEKSKEFMERYFYQNNLFNQAVFGNGLFFFDKDKKFVYGEFYKLNITAMINDVFHLKPVPEILKGETPESKEFLDNVLKDDFQHVVDINDEELMGIENVFYLAMTIEMKDSTGNKAIGYAVSLFDERPIRLGHTMVSDICVSEYRPSSRNPNAPDFIKENEKGLVPFAVGSFPSVAAAGGNYRTVTGQSAVKGKFKDTVCYLERNKSFDDFFLGFTYVAIKDVTKGDKNETLLILRLDRDLDVSNYLFKVFSTLCLAIIVISILAACGTLFVFEVFVMKNLHKTKESIEKIVMERKAIIQEYFNNDTYLAEYYSFKEHHGRSLEEELDMAVLDTGGSSDDLAVLGAIAAKYQQWMEEILLDKLSHLEIVHRENELLEDSLDMLNTWSGRPDTEFAPSFIAMAEANKEVYEEDDDDDDGNDAKSRKAVEEELPLISFGQILRNPIALEFFKTFCINNHIQNSLFFVLDVAWLGLLEETEITRHSTTKTVLTSIVSSTRHQVYSMFSALYEEYFAHPNKHLEPLKLNPRIQKRIMNAVKNGKLPYKQYFFKQAAADVRHTLENDYLPQFYASPLYKALLLNLKFTFQLNDDSPSRHEQGIYNMPHIQVRERSATEIGEKEDKRRKQGMWGTVKLAVFGNDEIADRIVEEKKLKETRARAGSSAPTSPSSRIMTPLQKLRSPAARARESSHGSVPSSPLANLLPAAKPKSTTSTPRSGLRDSVVLAGPVNSGGNSIFAAHKRIMSHAPSALKEDTSRSQSEMSEDNDHSEK